MKKSSLNKEEREDSASGQGDTSVKALGKLEAACSGRGQGWAAWCGVKERSRRWLGWGDLKVWMPPWLGGATEGVVWGGSCVRGGRGRCPGGGGSRSSQMGAEWAGLGGVRDTQGTRAGDWMMG